MQEIVSDQCHVISSKNLRVLVRMMLMRRHHLYEKLKKVDEAVKEPEEKIYWNMIYGKVYSQKRNFKSIHEQRPFYGHPSRLQIFCSIVGLK